MANLKTYTISIDVTGGAIDLNLLSKEIEDSGSVNSFEGLTHVDGSDTFDVYGASFANETTCDTTVQNHTLPAMEPLGVRFEYLSADLSTADPGTFNGLSCLGASPAILYDRWVFRGFGKTDTDCATFEFVLKDDYVDGSNIQIEVDWTTSQTSGQVHWHLGLCKPTATGDFGGETETTYVEIDTGAPTTSNWENLTFNTIYNTPNCKAGDSLVVVIIREGNHTNDNLNGDSYIRGVKLIY